MSAARSRDAAYLPYVDGLRAVAIVAVVGYHIGWPGFSGGFVGVDVFFVISGFLIIGHITGQIARGRFALMDFYARRVLRLLPLLLSVILATCVIAPFVLVTPDQFKDFGASAAAAALMYSNHFFLEKQGYFDGAADTKVLLHTWSLGVEAQFYAVAPLLIGAAALLSARFGHRRAVTWSLGALVALLSFAGCIVATDAGKNGAFFLMAWRAWEFAAGAAVPALAARLRKLPAKAADIVGAAGLAAIVGCVALYSPALVYPSAWPILPVLGATAAIAAGEAFERSAIRRLLSLPPLAAIGLVSYGWYLWHWPLLTFNRIYHFGTHALGSDTLAAGLLGLVMAGVTYVAVERPVVRYKAVLLGRRRWIPVAAGLAACLLAAAPGMVFKGAVADRLARQLDPAAWPAKTSLRRVADACILRDDMQLAADCPPAAVAPASIAKLGLLAGDSHAREAYPMLTAQAARAGAGLITMVQSGCPPLFDVEVLLQGQPQGCARDWQTGIKSLSARRPPLAFAILESSWSLYLGGESNGRLPRTLADAAGRRTAADQVAALGDGLKRAIETLRGLGVRRILIVAPEPQFLRDAPECLLRARKLALGPQTCWRPQAEVETQHRRTLAVLAGAAGQGPDIRVIDPFTVLCDGTTCRPERDGVPLYVDDNHLSRLGYDRVFAAYAADYAWVFGPAPETQGAAAAAP